jgi:multiple sugar transport system permease protein
MMIPGQVTMMPVFILLKEMHLLNTYTGLILPGAASVFAIFLLRQYMMGIPDSLLEAARIDGCSEFTLFWKVMIPLSMPAIATLTIFTFMGAWNEFLWALIIMLDESKYTLPVALAALSGGEHGMEWGLLMAGSVVTIIPVLAVFLSMQKHYIEGIAVTGMKE